jgi:hypothetical protein
MWSCELHFSGVVLAMIVEEILNHLEHWIFVETSPLINTQNRCSVTRKSAAIFATSPSPPHDYGDISICRTGGSAKGFLLDQSQRRLHWLWHQGLLDDLNWVSFCGRMPTGSMPWMSAPIQKIWTTYSHTKRHSTHFEPLSHIERDWDMFPGLWLLICSPIIAHRRQRAMIFVCQFDPIVSRGCMWYLFLRLRDILLRSPCLEELSISKQLVVGASVPQGVIHLPQLQHMVLSTNTSHHSFVNRARLCAPICACNHFRWHRPLIDAISSSGCMSSSTPADYAHDSASF